MDERTRKATETRKKNRKAKIDSTYNNKGWMFSRYCIDRMSLDEIADLCKVEYDIIWNALNQLKIPIIIMVGRDLWWAWVEKYKSKIPYKEI